MKIDKNRWLIKLFVVCAVVPPAIFILWGCVWPTGLIGYNLYQGETAKSIFLEGLTNRYPDLKVRAGCSYQSPLVYIGVTGIASSAKQTEIKNWLANEREKRRLPVDIHIEFYKEQYGVDGTTYMLKQ